jgi:uncharacterized membrane protein
MLNQRFYGVENMATAATPPLARFSNGRHGRKRINIGEHERWLSLISGGFLLASGLVRGSWRGLGLSALGAAFMYRGATGHCSVYEALEINRNRDRNRAIGVRAGHGFKYETTLFINRPAEELYELWRDLERLPQIMTHLVSVTRGADWITHWVAEGPFGSTIEWDAETINDSTNELIAWRSIPGSQLDTAGSVHFTPAPGSRGTIVRISLKYDPPGGKAGATLAQWLGSGLEKSIENDLRRFKQVVEAGEAPTTDGQPRGTCRSDATFGMEGHA